MTRTWFSRLLPVGVLIGGVVVLLDLIAVGTGFHGADGVFDCGLHCSTWQNVVGWSGSVGALLVLVLAIAIVLRESFGDGSR